jgi:rSAM/selenodomain-associated transferase 2
MIEYTFEIQLWIGFVYYINGKLVNPTITPNFRIPSKKMFISIIIPTLNEEATIAGLIDYLNACPEIVECEILVADAGSTDKTQEIAHLKNIRIINCSIQCRATQMNEAAKKASGEVLYFVHADTIPPKNFVSDIRMAIARGHALGGYRFRFNPNKGMLRFNSYMTRFNLLSFRGGDQTLFITRSAWDILRGYDEKFVVMEEYDLLQRASSKGFLFYLMPSEVLVSDRKYHNNGWLRVNFANLVAMTLFRFHTSPLRIKKIYSSLLKNSVPGYKST